MKGDTIYRDVAALRDTIRRSITSLQQLRDRVGALNDKHQLNPRQYQLADTVATDLFMAAQLLDEADHDITSLLFECGGWDIDYADDYTKTDKPL